MSNDHQYYHHYSRRTADQWNSSTNVGTNTISHLHPLHKISAYHQSSVVPCQTSTLMTSQTSTGSQHPYQPYYQHVPAQAQVQYPSFSPPVQHFQTIPQFVGPCDPCSRSGSACDGMRPCTSCQSFGISHMCNSIYVIPYQYNPAQRNMGYGTQKSHVSVPQQQGVYQNNMHNVDLLALLNDIQNVKSIVIKLQERILNLDTIAKSDSKEGKKAVGSVMSSIQSPLKDDLHTNVSSETSEWDMCDPDFIHQNKKHLDLPQNLDVEVLAESVWSPLNLDGEDLISSKRTVVNSPWNSDKASVAFEKPKHQDKKKLREEMIQAAGYSEFELARLKHAFDLLACFGVSLDHRPKIELYAEVVAHKAVIKCVNDEFCQLVGGTRSEVIGRSLRDFIPRSFEQWFNFLFHRELVASEKSSVIFENVLARLNGSVFRCFNSINVFFDINGRLCETHLSIQLSSVCDLPVPSLNSPLPRTSPSMSSEVEYPESPLPCHCDKQPQPSPAKKARIKK